MAVYSIIGGEATGAGALLAASALAFGLLAVNVDRAPRDAVSNELPLVPRLATGGGDDTGAPVQPVAVPGVMYAQLNATRVNGDLDILTGEQQSADIDVEPITQRERETLALVAEGYSNKLISTTLGIAERTVKNHLTLTMTKLRASDRTHAVVTAVRRGWLDI